MKGLFKTEREGEHITDTGTYSIVKPNVMMCYCINLSDQQLIMRFCKKMLMQLVGGLL